MAGHGGNFNLLKQPNTWQCLKIPHDSRTQDCQQRKNIELIENIRYVAMLKNSAMFENTDERRKSWKYHKIFSHGAFDFWRYHKIASNGEKFKLFNLKPPTRQFWKYHKIAGHGGTLKLLKHTQYLAISEDTPSLPPTVEYLNHWSLRIPQDCRPRGKIWVIEAPKYFAAAQYLAIFENTTRLSETDKTFYLLKPPNIWQCLKRPQDWRPRGGNLR